LNGRKINLPRLTFTKLFAGDKLWASASKHREQVFADKIELVIAVDAAFEEKIIGFQRFDKQ
jgi:hypothetical protein